jgi:hypothetical protein
MVEPAAPAESPESGAIREISARLSAKSEDRTHIVMRNTTQHQVKNLVDSMKNII